VVRERDMAQIMCMHVSKCKNNKIKFKKEKKSCHKKIINV
jgi:hypothetical protein